MLLNSPTATERDRTVVEYLERAIGVEAMEFGSEMFAAGSDVAGVPADEIVARDIKEYTLPSGGDDRDLADRGRRPGPARAHAMSSSEGLERCARRTTTSSPR